MATSDRTLVKIRNFFIEMEVIAEFAEVFFDQSFGGSLDSFGSDSSLKNNINRKYEWFDSNHLPLLINIMLFINN